MLVWYEVLHQYWAQGNMFSQLFGFSKQKHLKYISKVLFNTSLWPSICEWYEELIANFVSCNSNNLFQKLLMKTLSLSEIMVIGNPWSLTTCFKKTSATCLLVEPVLRGRKCANLYNRSITTMITV